MTLTSSSPGSAGRRRRELDTEAPALDATSPFWAHFLEGTSLLATFDEPRALELLTRADTCCPARRRGARRARRDAGRGGVPAQRLRAGARAPAPRAEHLGAAQGAALRGRGARLAGRVPGAAGPLPGRLRGAARGAGARFEALGQQAPRPRARSTTSPSFTRSWATSTGPSRCTARRWSARWPTATPTCRAGCWPTTARRW